VGQGHYPHPARERARHCRSNHSPASYTDARGGALGALERSQLTTLLRVKDPERARRFYAERLGLPYLGTTGDGKHQFAVGGAVLALSESEAAPDENTVLSFDVSDVPTAVADLQAQGVAFEDYDLPGLKTVDHVCVLGAERAAWFLDTEGNILCVHETLGERGGAQPTTG
jgi:catechol 2,3-dioxygenase-like lactoylglutathione lyase family enzyme